MQFANFFSTPQFWATLLGAATAFLLGMVATWRNNARIKRDAGNLALIALSQMYSIAENLRYHILVKEPVRAMEASGLAEPHSYLLRPVLGLASQPPSIDLNSLGFLVDSHDPDVLNRLLGVERDFNSELDLVRRHAVLHLQLQEKLSTLDPTGRTEIPVRVVIEKIGVRDFIEVEDVIEDLQSHLQETCDFILAVGVQLRQALCWQFPARAFVRFVPTSRGRRLSDAPEVRPRLWRRIARAVRDIAMMRIPLEKPLRIQPTDEPATGPKVLRLIKRSFESNISDQGKQPPEAGGRRG